MILSLQHQNLCALGDSLNAYPRVAITGGPLTGKSLVAAQLLGHVQVLTDDFMHLPWGEQPDAILAECRKHPHFVLSGVQAARALRCGLRVDIAVFLETALVPLTPTQARMAQGIRTIFTEWHTANPTTKVLYL